MLFVFIPPRPKIFILLFLKLIVIKLYVGLKTFYVLFCFRKLGDKKYTLGSSVHFFFMNFIFDYEQNQLS